MKRKFRLKQFIMLIAIPFLCGMLVRTIITNMNQPEFAFCRTFEPQFALVVETKN